MSDMWRSLLLSSNDQGRCHFSDTSPWWWSEHRDRLHCTYTSWCCTCSWFLIITTIVSCTLLRIDVISWLRRQLPRLLIRQSSTNTNSLVSWSIIHLVTWTWKICCARVHLISLWTFECNWSVARRHNALYGMNLSRILFSFLSSSRNILI